MTPEQQKVCMRYWLKIGYMKAFLANLLEIDFQFSE